MSAEFGHAAREHFSLDRDGVFLNHGSFGATPRPVLAAQSRWRETMENQPDIFFRRLMKPGIRAAAGVLAPAIGARAEDLAFVENPTAGINTVLQRLTYRPGDEILIASTTYNAVRISVDDVCKRFGAKVRTVALPMPMPDADQAVEAYASAAGPNTRIAIVDHIVSPAGFVLPVARIAAALKRKGVLVLVDGAHAAGQIPFDVSRIGADWYTGTLHKWLFMPKGSAFFWAAPEVQSQTLPLMVSHWIADGFPRAFDYTGTRDATAWLCMPDALSFAADYGLDRIMAHNRALALAGAKMVSRLGAEPAAPSEYFAAMQSMILPTKAPAKAEDAAELMNAMWDKHRVQIMSTVVDGRLLLRLSAQIYCVAEDFARAAEALDEVGWAGRAKRKLSLKCEQDVFASAICDSWRQRCAASRSVSRKAAK